MDSLKFKEWLSEQELQGNLSPAVLKGKVFYPYSWNCPWAIKFNTHKDGAGYRIGSELTFEQYLRKAFEAGMTCPSNIGNKPGKYQLGRIGDKGIYKEATCRFITFEENRSEMNSNGGSQRSGMSRRGVNNCQFTGMLTTPFGKFANTREASDASGVHKEAIRYRVSSPNFPDYYKESSC